MDTNKLTGYPSIDKPWMKYYGKEAFEKSQLIPSNTTIWEFIEEELKKQGDEFPAIKYFGRKISRSDFIKQVYNWARVFRYAGVQEDEVVCIYSPWVPEIAYIIFALNAIGAVPYCLKLAMSQKDLEIETSKSKVAVVFDMLWDNVKSVFESDKFEKIFIVSPSHSMAFPTKQIVSFSNRKVSSVFKKSAKYIFADKAVQWASSYSGKLKASYAPNRTAFITSSSGTSINGTVKGIMITNESAIAQCLQAKAAKINYNSGGKTLTNLPPTASTALCTLYLYPLFFNLTMIIEPRMSENEFYKQVKKYKPNVVLITGALWHRLFSDVEQEIKSGKHPDLSFFESPIIGGEGVNAEELKWMNTLMKQCNSKSPLFHGYGLSEAFSVISCEELNVFQDVNHNKDVVDVGIPFPGITVGVFGEDGTELSYNKRGELCIRSNTVMKGYYGKDELTQYALRNGWLHTGDLFEIDENGFLYCYGRMSDKVDLGNGDCLYLFDVVNELCKDENVKYAIVNYMGNRDGLISLAAHIVFYQDNIDAKEMFKKLDAEMKDFLPESVCIAGYKQHSTRFLVSPTTAKKDRNYYAADLKGYIKPTESGYDEVNFE